MNKAARKQKARFHCFRVATEAAEYLDTGPPRHRISEGSHGR